ncbi:DNA topoisomerase IB, partial [Ralstonia sp. 1B3]
KDYRTWAGSVLALDLLRGRPATNATEARRQVVEAIAAVAQRLGNTPAVCRKCYVHPAVVDAFLAGELEALPPVRARKGLRREEVALLQFLERTAGTNGAGKKSPPEQGGLRSEQTRTYFDCCGVMSGVAGATPGAAVG